MRLCFPFFLFGSIMEALAPSIPVIAVGRFLSGVGAGACMVVGPVYVSEIAPVVVKGTLGASTQVAINIGILLAQVLGYFLSYGSKWRIILGVGGGIAVLHFLGLLSGVESPEWLGSKGETTAARQALHKIRSGQLAADEERKWGASRDGEGEHTGRPNPPAPTDEATEHTSLLTPPRSPASSTGSGTHKERESVGMFAVLRHPDHQRAIVAVIAVMLAQQLCGINSVMMYSVSFLSELLPTGAALITVAVGALNVVVTLACAPLADRLGRKRCLLLSIAGMGSMSFLLAFGIMYRVPALTGAATLAFVAAFAVGLGPVPFILASELVGPEAVGATQSWALASNWLATFVVAQFFPMLNDAMGRGRVFFVFTALAVVFFSFIAWWVPESRGKANADEVWGRTDRRED
jgi:MFS family permease